ncbi:MAG: TSCPD domain-containing protein, partial [Lentisphaeria bacterium]|nr:TSCPD domain-containing protein [Lentisphaeria bacterium]
MHYTYQNSPLVCSSKIDIDVENGVVTNVAFTGGCP